MQWRETPKGGWFTFDLETRATDDSLAAAGSLIRALVRDQPVTHLTCTNRGAGRKLKMRPGAIDRVLQLSRETILGPAPMRLSGTQMASTITISPEKDHVWLRTDGINCGDWVRGLAPIPSATREQIDAIVRVAANSTRMGLARMLDDDFRFPPKRSRNEPRSFPRAPVPPSAPPPLHDVWWYMVFGREWIDALGRGRILSAPAHRVEEVGSECIIVQAWPEAGDYLTESGRETQAQLLHHLNPDIGLDEARDRYELRHYEREEVKPDWDPDLDGLLHLVANWELDPRNRSLTFARWNEHSCPPVTEVCGLADAPSTAQPASLVSAELRDDAETAMVRISRCLPHGRYHEPHDLPLVDFVVWLIEVAEPFVFPKESCEIIGRGLAVHLGELLVEHLGGSWMVSKDPADTYVRIGAHAWFPFRRTKNALQSKSAAIDYSLTKFWCEAARTAGVDPDMPRGWPVVLPPLEPRPRWVP